MALPEAFKRLDVYDTILIFLYVLAAVGIYQFGVDALVTLAVTTVTAVVLDAAIYKIRKRPPTFRALRKALITAVLVAFLVPPGLPLYVPAFAAALAVASKHVLRLPEQKHVFNPAALGALTASLLFVFPTAWWGADAYLVWILGVLLIYKFKRLELPITLLLVYSVLSIVGFYLGFSTAGVDALLQNTPLVMLAFFMATEPVTTPFTRKGRVVFGALTAVFILALSFVGRFDALLAGLLLANTFTRPLNNWTKNSATQP